MGRKKLTSEEREQKKEEAMNKLRSLIDMVDEIDTLTMSIGLKKRITNNINMSNIIVRPTKIVQYVNERFDVNIGAKTRRRKVINARYTAMHLLRKFTQLTLGEIAMYTGVTDHTTVLYGLKQIRNFRELEPETDITIKQCEEDIFRHFKESYK